MTEKEEKNEITKGVIIGCTMTGILFVIYLIIEFSHNNLCL